MIWREVATKLPVVSRATVYNTLNLFVKKGLLRELSFADGTSVFDPKIEPHHHFIDETTGAIRDIPWDAVAVKFREKLEGFDVTEYQVVMRGKYTHRYR